MTARFLSRGRIASTVAWTVFILLVVPVTLVGIYSALAGTRR